MVLLSVFIFHSSRMLWALAGEIAVSFLCHPSRCELKLSVVPFRGSAGLSVRSRHDQRACAAEKKAE